jgi:hypothetical protein
LDAEISPFTEPGLWKVDHITIKDDINKTSLTINNSAFYNGKDTSDLSYLNLRSILIYCDLLQRVDRLLNDKKGNANSNENKSDLVTYNSKRDVFACVKMKSKDRTFRDKGYYFREKSM